MPSFSTPKFRGISQEPSFIHNSITILTLYDLGQISSPLTTFLPEGRACLPVLLPNLFPSIASLPSLGTRPNFRWVGYIPQN